MSAIYVKGTNGLFGAVDIHGSKNAILPVLAASMVVNRECIVLENCPDISDVRDMISLMEYYGAGVRREKRTIFVNSANLKEREPDEGLYKRTRASVLMLSVLMSVFGRAVMPMPGGCVIGDRPVDEHIKVLEALGAKAYVDKGYIYAAYKNQRAADITLGKRSVGATQNAIICAVAVKGKTVIKNAAVEPEVTALCDFLARCGTSVKYDCLNNIIVINGATEYEKNSCDMKEPVVYRIRPDRIVAGTYAIAAAACGGEVQLNGYLPEENEALTKLLKRAGAEYIFDKESVIIRAAGKRRRPVSIVAEVYPGYATDLQPQLIAAMTMADGVSTISDNVFSERFAICNELKKAGADISVSGNKAVITGVRSLKCAEFNAMDLRAGAGLCIAALMAEGESIINGVAYINRGYEDICRDLRELGAETDYRRSYGEKGI